MRRYPSAPVARCLGLRTFVSKAENWETSDLQGAVAASAKFMKNIANINEKTFIKSLEGLDFQMKRTKTPGFKVPRKKRMPRKLHHNEEVFNVALSEAKTAAEGSISIHQTKAFNMMLSPSDILKNKKRREARVEQSLHPLVHSLSRNSLQIREFAPGFQVCLSNQAFHHVMDSKHLTLEDMLDADAPFNRRVYTVEEIEAIRSNLDGKRRKRYSRNLAPEAIYPEFFSKRIIGEKSVKSELQRRTETLMAVDPLPPRYLFAGYPSKNPAYNIRNKLHLDHSRFRAQTVSTDEKRHPEQSDLPAECHNYWDGRL